MSEVFAVSVVLGGGKMGLGSLGWGLEPWAALGEPGPEGQGAGMHPQGWTRSEIPQELIPGISYVKGCELGCRGCN